jgi:hypothetical protein
LSAWKTKDFADKNNLLTEINICAEELQKYRLKAATEKILMQSQPENTELKLKYMDSLFNLSTYSDLLTYSKSNKNLKSFANYRLLRAKSFYELNQYENSISELTDDLENASSAQKSEIYYWLGKSCYANKDYDAAKVYFEKAQNEKESLGWIQAALPRLIQSVEQKNKKFKLSARFRFGYDNNILKENIKKKDSMRLFDLMLDYDYSKSATSSTTFGIDGSYQGYGQNNIYQTSLFLPRFSHSSDLTDSLNLQGTLAMGKLLTDNKADQNFLLAVTELNYRFTSDFELKNSISYFSNLNNNPVKQYLLSSIAELDIANDSLWFGFSIKKSEAPQPVIDANTYVIPTVTESSLSARYQQTILVGGYLKNFSDNYSLKLQYNLTHTQYENIDLTSFDATKAEGSGQRADLNQSAKASLFYKPSVQWRYEIQIQVSENKSKGFQGFYSTDKPSNSYDQNQILTGVTYRWP